MKMDDGFIWFFFPLSKSETTVKPVPIHTDGSALSHDLSFCSRVLKKKSRTDLKMNSIRAIRRSKKDRSHIWESGNGSSSASHFRSSYVIHIYSLLW